MLNTPQFGLKKVKTIKQFDNLVMLINDYSLYLYDIKKNIIIYQNLASQPAWILHASIFENQLYIIQTPDYFKKWQLVKFDLLTQQEEFLMDLKSEDIGDFVIKKIMNGDKLLIPYNQFSFSTINLNLKKKEVSKTQNDSGSFFREYLCTDNAIYCAGASLLKINFLSSEIIWNKKLDLINFPSNILIDSDNAFVATEKGILSKYNTTNGDIIWSSDKMPDGFYHIEFMNGFVYMSDGKKIFILNSSNGSIVLQQINNFQVGFPWIFDKKNNLFYTPKDGRFCELKGL